MGNSIFSFGFARVSEVRHMYLYLCMYITRFKNWSVNLLLFKIFKLNNIFKIYENIEQIKLFMVILVGGEVEDKLTNPH